MRRVLVPIHKGFEEIEFISIVDILRRGGAQVTVASIHPGSISIAGSHKVVIRADADFEDVKSQEFDLIVCPGGLENAKGLAAHAGVVEKFKQQKAAGKWYGAICATPKLFLEPHGLLQGVQATSYPSLGLNEEFQAEGNVVVSGRCITSRSPGTALEFGLRLVEHVIGRPQALEVAEGCYTDIKL